MEEKSFKMEPMEKIPETPDEQTTTLTEPSFKSEDVDMVFRDFGQVVDEEAEVELECLAKPKVKVENTEHN